MHLAAALELLFVSRDLPQQMELEMQTWKRSNCCLVGCFSRSKVNVKQKKERKEPQKLWFQFCNIQNKTGKSAEMQWMCWDGVLEPQFRYTDLWGISALLNKMLTKRWSFPESPWVRWDGGSLSSQSAQSRMCSVQTASGLETGTC